MYLPKHFEETRPEVLHGLLKRHPLATLVTLGPAGLVADHIPLKLWPGLGPHGTLRGHVARSNPLWRVTDRSVDALAVFQGPEAYVTPSWYPGKRETGKVVPTWNYVVAHAYGTLMAYDDPSWVRRLLEDLTAEHEADFPAPWRPSDAPADFLEGRIAAVVGIEIAITRITGKWKLSQNQPEANRAGVIEGLCAKGTPGAEGVAGHMEEP
jgi:transcriptional regulator